VATHGRQDFLDTNLTGTLNLLEEAASAGVAAFVFTSTTSAFGGALTPPARAPAVWVTEDVRPVPRNIYGVTKAAAEDLCELFHRSHRLACLILRTSRFFPEDDDNPAVRHGYARANAQANELLFRRVDLQDVVTAHLKALARAAELGFARFIVSATTPFSTADLLQLRADAPAALARIAPAYRDLYDARGWRMFPSIDRVYVNTAARECLGWEPRYDFHHVLRCLRERGDFRSELARLVGIKGYHDRQFDDGPYPVLSS
jgi:UDP-glucose 4-epimerase